MEVYVIFHCDEWQTYSSMRLIGVASADGLRDVMHTIQEQLGYSDEEMDTFIYVKQTNLDDINDMNI